ncbi:MAG TPA: tetratricopeptide repeat protein [Longimicrobiales bacterium]|nr:tetratricopeptide repeat protein [Longimicrobiales bacterium]
MILHCFKRAATLGPLLALAAGVVLAPPAQAQGRFKVLVPNLQPAQGANKSFGENVADKLRDLIDDMDTHVAVERNEMRQALKTYDLNEGEMGCIQWRQLAVQMRVEIVFCGDYSEAANNRTVNAQFQGARSGEPFNVPQFSSANDDQAAQQIHGAFQNYVQQLRSASICVDYLGSQQWDNALNACNEALAANPNLLTARYSRARANLGKAEAMEGTNGDPADRTPLLQEALADLDALLEQNPVHEGALQSAGYVATLLGDGEMALGYYRQMLELDPTNTDIRIRLALDLMNAGDPAGALALAEEGVSHAPEDPTLKLYLGHFATAYAQELEQSEDPAEQQRAMATYEKAVENYGAVTAAQPDSADVIMIRNMLLAYPKVGRTQEVLGLGREALTNFPEDAGIRIAYARLQKDEGDLSGAMASLEEARAIDPEAANYDGIMASWLIEAGRLADARRMLNRAVEGGKIARNDVANLLFGYVVNGPYKERNWGETIPILEEALTFAEDTHRRAQINFFLGYSLLQQGIGVQDGETAATARRALPIFQRARDHLGRADAYTEQAGNLANLRSAAAQYIDIQEAVIRRGR